MLCKQHVHDDGQLASMGGLSPTPGLALPSCLLSRPWEKPCQARPWRGSGSSPCPSAPSTVCLLHRLPTYFLIPV